jgi:gliding motility-associated-like protein
LVEVSFTPDTAVNCSPLKVTFSNTTSTALSCNWDFGDGDSSNSCSPDHTYTLAGIYSVKLTIMDSNGCSGSLIKDSIISVLQAPTAVFNMNPQPTTIINPTISFTSQSIQAIRWNWSFGDTPQSTSNLENPQFTYPDSGHYQVQLIVTSVDGCSDTITHTVIVKEDFVIYIPNAFTPNDDGINDVFLPSGTGISSNNYNLQIFDRWGELVFKSTSLNIGWNGKIKNVITPENVYVYKLYVEDVLNKRHEFSGNITLLK